MQSSVIMSRGKKRMGYELELKINFKGIGKWTGLTCEIELSDLCDDGGDPEHRLNVDSSNGTGNKFKTEASAEKLVEKVTEKIREILQLVRDEA